MSKIGVLQQVSGTNILIDGVWYDGTNIIQYLPQRTGIQVEYNADNNNVLAYIREVSNRGSFVSRAPQPSRPSRQPSRGTRQQFPSQATSSSGSRDASIIKQVIFKGAIELTKCFTFSSPDEMLDTMDYIYQQLVNKYSDILK